MPDPSSQNVSKITWSEFDRIGVRDLYAILAMRSEIFVVEQDCAFQDVDGRDLLDGNNHAWIHDDQQIVAYLRVFPCDNGTLKISRVITASSHRHQGLAAALMRSAIARFPDRPLVLDAQRHLVDWYEQFGFVADGEPFLEDEILHVPMRLTP